MKQKRERSKGVLTPLIFIALAIAVTLCGIGIGTASAATTVEISPSAKTVNNSDMFTLYINVTQDEPIKGVQCDLSFNQSLVTVNSVTEGNLLDQDGASTMFGVTKINNTIGNVDDVYCIITSGSPVSSSGTFAIINLTADAANEGITDILLSDVKVRNATNAVVPTSTANGSITVGVPAVNLPPSVSVVYPNGGETLSGTVTVNATASDSDGTVTNVEFLYSADAGSTWTNLGSTTEPYEYEWDTTAVSNGANYLIKAIATDDDGATNEDLSNNTFTIGNIPTTTVVTITPSSKNVGNSAMFTLNITVNPIEPIKGVQCDLSFNQSLVTVNGVTEGNLLSQGGASTMFGVTKINNTIGSVDDVYCIITSGSPVSSSGTFAVINLTADAANEGITDILLSDVKVRNATNAVIATSTVNGSVTVGVAEGPTIVSYTILPQTITPPQTTEIDVEFSETVDYRIAIEKDTATIYDWTGTAKDPNAKVWAGTYEANGTDVPAGVYTVNVSGTNTTTGLSVANSTETITVQAPLVPHVVINEFVAGPATLDWLTEWIELYNPTDAEVDLTGWTISSPPSAVDITSLDGKTIPAGGYLALEGLGGPPDFTFSLANSGDMIVLKNGTTVVDQVAYGDYDDGNVADNAPAPGADNSTGRYPNGVDTDVDGDDFHDFTTPTIGESNGEPSVLTTITVTPATANVAVGGTREFTATAKDQNSEVMADVGITWTSSNATVGTVSPLTATTVADGTATTTFTALVNGTTTVMATSGDVSGTAEVTVTSVINGYKGKRYTAGEDIKTLQTHIINGNVLYSVGDSYYLSGSTAWETYTANWTASDLPVPTDATIVKARLYVYYTWDKVEGMPDNVSMTFNDNPKTRDAFYTDRKGFGSYDYPSGMLAYDVTADFDASGNTAVLENLNPVAGNPSIYGMLLVVIYEKTGEMQRTIWLNEECDILQARDDYNVSSTEATAFAPFAGTIEDVVNKSATLITVVPSGDEGDDKNKLYFNTGEWHGIWDGFAGSTQLGINETDVTDYLSSTDNLAKLQSNIPAGETKGDYIVATNAILVVTTKVEGLMEGDVNMNMHVTMVDAMYIAQYKAGLRELNESQLKCADTTDEGVVSLIDAMHIAQWKADPDGTLGVLYKPLWNATLDADMLEPVDT